MSKYTAEKMIGHFTEFENRRYKNQKQPDQIENEYGYSDNWTFYVRAVPPFTYVSYFHRPRCLLNLERFAFFGGYYIEFCMEWNLSLQCFN